IMKLWRGRTATSNQHQVENSAGMLNQDEQYQQALAALIDVMERAADGDLEVRAPAIEHIPELETFRGSMNRLLDVMDAFVRESQAALSAAADGRYHRRFLAQGMPGRFRAAAHRIDEGRASMKQSADRLA